MRRMLAWMIVATVAAISCSCEATRVSTKRKVPAAIRPVAQDASREELLEKYNAVAQGVKSINATVELKPTAGSQYSGIIEEYHEVKAFLLAARPAKIRMIGQAPIIGKTIFDMNSDGQTFRVSIPSKNKFLVGSVTLERNSSKPIENLRPQHLLDALLWPDVLREESVLFEEFNDAGGRYYVLTVLRGGYQTEILRKVWFDRADLQVARIQRYGPKGVLVSDSHFSGWQPLIGDQEQVAPAAGGVTSFPREIRIERPHDDYQLELTLTKLMLNQEISADRFILEQPAGTELVILGEEDKRPPKEPKP
jgi:outer membrane lipoprotein-sorting protein